MKILTGNDLKTGAVVWWDGSGWSLHVEDAADTGDARAIMVNDAFAHRHLHGQDPLLRETDRGPIVGVAGDVHQERFDVPVAPEIYQVVSSDAGIASDLGMTLVVRGTGAIEPLIPALRKGSVSRISNVRILLGREFEVRLLRRRRKRIMADGELAGRTPAHFKIVPRALSVFAPPPANS